MNTNANAVVSERELQRYIMNRREQDSRYHNGYSGVKSTQHYRRRHIHFDNVVKSRIFVFMIIFLFIIGSILIGSSISGFANTEPKEQTTYKYYTSIAIEKGDTLWSIAAKYKTSEYEEIGDYIKEIKRLNHLYDDKICSGKYLIIPYYSTELL